MDRNRRPSVDIAKFLRVPEAIPEGQEQYRPDPRATSTADLVWLLASELRDACELIDRGEVNFDIRPAPALNESIAVYEPNAEGLQQRLGAVDDSSWDRPARLLVNGAVVWETTLGDMLFGFLFDAIHHRGQALDVSAPDGREGSVDLRAVRRRSRHVNAPVRRAGEQVPERPDEALFW